MYNNETERKGWARERGGEIEREQKEAEEREREKEEEKERESFMSPRSLKGLPFM